MKLKFHLDDRFNLLLVCTLSIVSLLLALPRD